MNTLVKITFIYLFSHKVPFDLSFEILKRKLINLVICVLSTSSVIINVKTRLSTLFVFRSIYEPISINVHIPIPMAHVWLYSANDGLTRIEPRFVFCRLFHHRINIDSESRTAIHTKMTRAVLGRSTFYFIF